MHSLSKPQKAIAHIFEQYMQAYVTQNKHELLSHLSLNKGLCLIGTGADEKLLGPEMAEKAFNREFSQGKAVAYEVHFESIKTYESAAWACGDCFLKILTKKQEIVIHPRFSAFFEKTDKGWQIIHTHFSLPCLNQPFGEAYPCPQTA